MKSKIGCDFDGTLVQYGAKAGEVVKVNDGLLSKFQGKKITIITNQGGLAFGIMNSRRGGTNKYPLPEQFFQHYWDFEEEAVYRDVWVEGLYIYKESILKKD